MGEGEGAAAIAATSAAKGSPAVGVAGAGQVEGNQHRCDQGKENVGHCAKTAAAGEPPQRFYIAAMDATDNTKVKEKRINKGGNGAREAAARARGGEKR